ncbi:MAG: hypothetical protein K9G49_10060 [Taibaiella sp.]|nr:hypothetical protein [Taibaiella sp.]
MSKISTEQRRKASIDMTLTFFGSYYPSWRLAKVLGIRKILATRYDFYSDLASEVSNPDDDTGEAAIAQELKNGLYFDAIAECVQYVEDLFAILKASEKPDYFINGIVTYEAHKISKYIKNYVVDKKGISSAFHLPNDYQHIEEADKKLIDESVEKLASLVSDCIKFYNHHRLIYNQYKHGLTVAMRTYGNKFSEEQINEDKKGSFPPNLSILDNINVKKAFEKGRNYIPGIIMPNFSDNIRTIYQALSEEDNLLRLVPIHDSDIDIELFVDFAYKVRICLETFIFNYTWKIKPEEGKIKFQLPDNHRKNTYLTCVLTLDKED